jgi:hypothetical protein
MKSEIIVLVTWMMFRVAVGNPGYEMNIYRKSPGVYFEDLGHVTLSNTAWTLVVYVPLQITTNQTTELEQYARYIDRTCARMTVRNWTACNHFGEIMGRKLQQIKDTEELMSDIVQRGDRGRRSKRGLINFVGKISETLFGTMDDDDAQFYHDQIERLEQGSATLTHLLQQQLTVVKSTLCTFNETLTDVEFNERKVREGLKQLQAYVGTISSQLENVTHHLALKITIEDHIAKAVDASHNILRTLDILIASISNTQEGILPPRVVSPTSLLDALRNSSPSFPRMLPFLSRWVKTIFTCYTSLVIFTSTSTKSGWDT